MKIVSAYLSNNTIDQSDLPELITTVASRLRAGGTVAEQPAEERHEPAVSVRRSIRPDHLVWLVCGQPQRMLKRHLAVQHDLTPAEYRGRFGLKPDYPMAAPNYARQRREVALATGLGRPKEFETAGKKSQACDRTRRAAGRRCWRVKWQLSQRTRRNPSSKRPHLR